MVPVKMDQVPRRTGSVARFWASTRSDVKWIVSPWTSISKETGWRSSQKLAQEKDCGAKERRKHEACKILSPRNNPISHAEPFGATIEISTDASID
jgi:hypothetical protein